MDKIDGIVHQNYFNSMFLLEGINLDGVELDYDRINLSENIFTQMDQMGEPDMEMSRETPVGGLLHNLFAARAMRAMGNVQACLDMADRVWDEEIDRFDQRDTRTAGMIGRASRQGDQFDPHSYFYEALNTHLTNSANLLAEIMTANNATGYAEFNQTRSITLCTNYMSSYARLNGVIRRYYDELRTNPTRNAEQSMTQVGTVGQAAGRLVRGLAGAAIRSAVRTIVPSFLRGLGGGIRSMYNLARGSSNSYEMAGARFHQLVVLPLYYLQLGTV